MEAIRPGSVAKFNLLKELNSSEADSGATGQFKLKTFDIWRGITKTNPPKTSDAMCKPESNPQNQFSNREIGDTHTKIPQGTKAVCPGSPSQRTKKPANSLCSSSGTKFGIESDTASSGDLSLSDHYEDVDKLCSEITVRHGHDPVIIETPIYDDVADNIENALKQDTMLDSSPGQSVGSTTVPSPASSIVFHIPPPPPPRSHSFHSSQRQNKSLPQKTHSHKSATLDINSANAMRQELYEKMPSADKSTTTPFSRSPRPRCMAFSLKSGSHRDLQSQVSSSNSTQAYRK